MHSKRSPVFRLMVWLTMLAVLWPAVVPLVHHAQPLLGATHICSSTPDKNSESGSKKDGVCPVCQSLAHFAHGFVPPDNVELGRAFGISVAQLEVRQLHLRALEYQTSAWPHAPPSLS